LEQTKTSDPSLAGVTRTPRALLLDFYGTVVQEDDAPLGRICAQVSAATPTGATPREVGALWSRHFRQLSQESYGPAFRLQKEVERLSLQRVLEHYRVDLDARTISQVLYDHWARPPICPESRDVLAECKLPICLVSNIDNAELRSALSHHDLRFDPIVTSEDCRAYKPRGEMFTGALSLLGLPPGEVLHVGDSLGSDVRGAQAMGIPVLWVNRRGRPLPEGEGAPDYVSADLWGVLDLLNG